jgi:hypothetical protein
MLFSYKVVTLAVQEPCHQLFIEILFVYAFSEVRAKQEHKTRILISTFFLHKNKKCILSYIKLELWIQLIYVKTVVNVTMCRQHNNTLINFF